MVVFCKPYSWQEEQITDFMNKVIRFALVFIICYGICLVLFQIRAVSVPFYAALKVLTTGSVSSSLPSADISSQWKNREGGGSDIYIVYGNPVLIQAAKQEAKNSGQRYATLPTKSLELHLFEMFIVPVLFLIGLYVATPMHWKPKLMNLCIAFAILIIYLLFKIILLSLFEISNARIGVYELGDSAMQFLGKILGVFSLGLTITLAFVLWLIFGFRNSRLAEDFKFVTTK